MSIVSDKILTKRCPENWVIAFLYGRNTNMNIWIILYKNVWKHMKRVDLIFGWLSMKNQNKPMGFCLIVNMTSWNFKVNFFINKASKLFVKYRWHFKKWSQIWDSNDRALCGTLYFNFVRHYLVSWWLSLTPRGTLFLLISFMFTYMRTTQGGMWFPTHMMEANLWFCHHGIVAVPGWMGLEWPRSSCRVPTSHKPPPLSHTLTSCWHKCGFHDLF